MSKHILFVSSWYPTPEKKSHGIFFKRHAEAAALLNQVSAIYIHSGSANEIASTTAQNVYTIIGTYKKVNHQIPIISNLMRLWRSLYCFKKCYHTLLKSSTAPDLVLLNVIFPAAIFVLWLNYFHKIPYIIQEQWSGYYPEDGNYKGFITKKVTELCVKYAKSVLVVSNKLEQSMKNHGLKNKYLKIGNVVDTTLFVPSVRQSNETFSFVHVSTVNDKEKNISGMIEAAKILFQKNKLFRIDIVGDGPERLTFESLASRYELLNKVIFFHGFQLPDDVAKIVSRSHCFILNSHYEGLPCVLLEAMSCGIPVITTNVGAVPEIINEKQGIIIKPNNHTMLANAMEQMIRTYDSYNSENIRKSVLNSFSYPAIAKDFDQIFDCVIKDE
jgi:glycosyltransferase involved in cell wall biosynthesis